MDMPNLIDSLVADIKPVAPISARRGIASVASATSIVTFAVIAVFGARADIVALAPAPIVVLRAMLLILLGLATSFAVIQAAKPAVGGSNNGWLWALASAMVMPAAAALLYGYHLMMAQPFAAGDMDFAYGPHCLAISGSGAALIGIVQILWLRQGAPTDLARAGWLVGLAAGSYGTFAYSLHCPSGSIYYVGLFYGLAVGLCALAGRAIVPRLIRW
jgi:hypothetical protein